MALCEMILACQLRARNWSDLHANGLCLLKDAGGCIIKRRDVQLFIYLFFPPQCPLISMHVGNEPSVLTLYSDSDLSVSDNKNHICFQLTGCTSVNEMPS